MTQILIDRYADPAPLGYLAGPYTNPDPVQNVHDAWQLGLRLYEQYGIPFHVPHLTLLAHVITPRPELFWYEYDFHLLDRCDFVFRMPGKSSGADREVARAEEAYKPVVHDEHSFQDLLVEWGWDWSEKLWLPKCVELDEDWTYDLDEDGHDERCCESDGPPPVFAEGGFIPPPQVYWGDEREVS